MKLKHLSLSVMVMGATFGLMSTQAVASGYQFGSQSVSGQGTAHANGAEANDPSTIFANPAGLSRLEGTQFSGGLTFVVPHSEYTDNGSTNFANKPTGGGNGGSFAPSVVVAPNFYLSHKLNDKINLGVGVFVPYGAKLDYDSGWAGRYALQNVDLKSFNINPSMSFKLDDRHAFGFGISAQYLDATLQQAADVRTGIGQLLAGANGMNPNVVGGALVQGQLNALGVSGDGTARISGDDWGFGWNIGYMFTLDENTRFGLAYRSAIKQKLEGTADWDFSNVKGNLAGLGIPNLPAYLSAKKHPDTSATVDVTTPETASANFFHQLNPKWAVMGDVTWVANSQMKDIVIKQGTVNSVSQGDITIHQNWRDTWRVSLGANYLYNDAWLFRGGVAWEQSPLKSDNDRHPAIPDSDRLWLSLGANYKINKQSSVDFAYSFINFANANVNYTDACSPSGNNGACTGNGGTVKGSYKTYLQLIGLQYNYRF